jgi:hypothetical protein
VQKVRKKLFDIKRNEWTYTHLIKYIRYADGKMKRDLLQCVNTSRLEGRAKLKIFSISLLAT